MGYRCHDNMDAVFCWQHQLPSPFLTSADGSQGTAAEVEAASPASGTILLLFFYLNPRKTRVGKKLKKLKRMERLMSRAVVQLKTIVQQNRIETK